MPTTHSTDEPTKLPLTFRVFLPAISKQTVSNKPAKTSKEEIRKLAQKLVSEDTPKNLLTAAIEQELGAPLSSRHQRYVQHLKENDNLERPTFKDKLGSMILKLGSTGNENVRIQENLMKAQHSAFEFGEWAEKMAEPLRAGIANTSEQLRRETIKIRQDVMSSVKPLSRDEIIAYGSISPEEYKLRQANQKI